MAEKFDQRKMSRLVKERLGWKDIPTPKTYLLKRYRFPIEEMEWMFRSLRLTRRDAFIEVDGNAIRLHHFFDKSIKPDRRKLKAEHYFVIPEFKGDPRKASYRVSKQELIHQLRKLDARIEKSAQGHLICKAPLVAAIKKFNEELLAVVAKDRKGTFIYKSENARARLIALWVNWLFKRKYGIESTYEPEQIRKLIKPSRRDQVK